MATFLFLPTLNQSGKYLENILYFKPTGLCRKRSMHLLVVSWGHHNSKLELPETLSTMWSSPWLLGRICPFYSSKKKPRRSISSPLFLVYILKDQEKKHRAIHFRTNFHLLWTFQFTFKVLVKALISLDPSDDLDFLKREFDEFIKGLICLPIKLPGTRLYKSLKVKITFLIFLNYYLSFNKMSYKIEEKNIIKYKWHKYVWIGEDTEMDDIK